MKAAVVRARQTGDMVIDRRVPGEYEALVERL